MVLIIAHLLTLFFYVIPIMSIRQLGKDLRYFSFHGKLLFCSLSLKQMSMVPFRHCADPSPIIESLSHDSWVTWLNTAVSGALILRFVSKCSKY